MPTKAELEAEVARLRAEIIARDFAELPDLVNLATFVHLHLCKLIHDEECNYYNEDNWTDPEHVRWMDVTVNLLEACNLDPTNSQDQVKIRRACHLYERYSLCGEQEVKMFELLLKF